MTNRALQVLQIVYKVVENNIIDKVRMEEYYYNEYMSGILARRAHIYMIDIKQDNDELPLFMINLGEGYVVTCYTKEEKYEY